MTKTKYNYVWEDELKAAAKTDNCSLSQYLKRNPQYIRYEKGDYGDKKMYIYKNENYGKEERSVGGDGPSKE
jgi:hypothetical protein